VRFDQPKLRGKEKSRPLRKVSHISTMRSILLILCLFIKRISGAYVSIDLGNGTFKAALVQSGKSPVMLINPQSKRTTPSAMMIRQPPKLIGSPALTMGIKYPYELIEFAHSLAGHSCLDETIIWPSDLHPYTIECDKQSDRWKVIVRDKKINLWPEEIIAHFINYVKNLAVEKIEEQSSSPRVASAAIKKLEFVLTLPVGASYREHIALQSAAEIAGVNLNDRVHSQLAASAAYHSSDITLDSGEALRKIVLDVGALNAQACLVKYEMPEHTGVVSRGLRTYVEECHRVGEGAGGLRADWKLTIHVLENYEKKFGKIKGQKRDKAIRRIMASVNKSKHVLSANKTDRLKIENLDGEGNHVDMTITREELEAMLTEDGLYEKLIGLLKRFDCDDCEPLKNRISSIELIGNGWRIPSIQEALSAKFGDIPFQTTINPDESTALGSLYLAAHDSKYKSPKIYVEDNSNKNDIMKLSRWNISNAKNSLDNIQGEDDRREQLEKDRNDFEQFLYKNIELLGNETKLEPVLTAELEEIAAIEIKNEEIKASKKEGSGWFSGIFGGSKSTDEPDDNEEKAIVKDTSKNEEEDDQEDGSGANDEEDLEDNSENNDSLMELSYGKPISERIPEAHKVIEEAKAWLESDTDGMFDKYKGISYKDDIKQLLQPLYEKLKQRKEAEAALRKARLEEKKAAKAAEKAAEEKDQKGDAKEEIENTTKEETNKQDSGTEEVEDKSNSKNLENAAEDL